MLPPLSPLEWTLAALGALCVGVAKSGFSGVGLAMVVIMAKLFPPRESTGILLPLLICGDLFAVANFRRHTKWAQIWRMLPPTCIGIVAGFLLMRCISDAKFSGVIGWTVLGMTALQAIRRVRPDLFQHVPHSPAFAWTMGGGAGLTTMLANAAGPVMALYLAAIKMPKYEFVGTSAWFFLIVNVLKVPFSAHLGLIHGSSLLFNLMLVPAVGAGSLLGRWLIRVVPQKLFDLLVLLFTVVASLRLIFA